jgi:hypothetical protein
MRHRHPRTANPTPRRSPAPSYFGKSLERIQSASSYSSTSTSNERFVEQHGLKSRGPDNPFHIGSEGQQPSGSQSEGDSVDSDDMHENPQSIQEQLTIVRPARTLTIGDKAPHRPPAHHGPGAESVISLPHSAAAKARRGRENAAAYQR